MELTLSFPVGILGDISHGELYKELYFNIKEVVHEQDVAGIQLYPSQWPRKVLITLKTKDAKEALMISGIDIMSQHIELRDESEQLTKVTIKDALIGWSEDKIRDLLDPYGKVIRVENEILYVNGRKTKWTTGTRFVYMCPIERNIPQKLTAVDNGKQVSVSVWYRRPQDAMSLKCKNCGGEHLAADCSFENKVCFICQGNHERKDCPRYDGSRVSKDVFCFLSEKSPLSNFSMDYPITINDQRYTCNEQYIQSEKAKLFGDFRKADLIMRTIDPRRMKAIGRDIKGYKDTVWKDHSHKVIYECVRQKIFQYREMQDYLLKTGSRLIGEGTTDKHFGVGLHISNPLIMNPKEWHGYNLMGHALMDVRSEVKILAHMTGRDDEMDLESSLIIPLDSDVSKSEEVEESDDVEQVVNKPVALLLGDSNIKDVELDLTESNFHVVKVARAESIIQDADELASDCRIEAESVKVVMCHLGTCNWRGEPGSHIDSGDLLYTVYAESLNALSSSFPQADLVLSGILPRNFEQFSEDDIEHQTSIKHQADILNDKLLELAQENENIVFIDNNDGFL